MTEQELLEEYNKHIPVYNEWGQYVTQVIHQELFKKLETKDKVSQFLKIPVKHRVKETSSIIEKAFYRKKNYADPFNDITDKVGIRIVLLIEEQISIIKDIIVNCGIWNHSLDRNYEEEKNNSPLLFAYQSVHYIVRNKTDIISNGITIPGNTPCEIQVRTILQHAYSELTHDTIYKPKMLSNLNIHRKIARSMALIETTDVNFNEVNMELQSLNKDSIQFINQLNSIYSDIKNADYRPELNSFIYESLEELIPKVKIEDIKDFLAKKDFIRGRILARYSDTLLFRQPIILLLYYLVDKRRTQLRKIWPLSDKDLEPIYNDLGIAFDIN